MRFIIEARVFTADVKIFRLVKTEVNCRNSLKDLFGYLSSFHLTFVHINETQIRNVGKMGFLPWVLCDGLRMKC